MALTVSNPADRTYYIDGHQKRSVRDFTFDDAYVTGGEVATAADFGLNYIDYATTGDIVATGAGVNVANAKAIKQTGGGSIKILLSDETPAEVASLADVATAVVRVEARGW